MGNSDQDLDAFVRNSTYRTDVLKHLAADGSMTPTTIAEATGRYQSHISRAISELREKGLVELRVSSDRRRGRLYGLTDTGQAVWERIEAIVTEVPWSVEAPRTDAERTLVSVTESAFGECLRLVGVFDGESVAIIYGRDDVLDRYTDEELQQGVQTFVEDYALSDVDFPNTSLHSEVKAFEAFSALRVRIDTETAVTVSVDADQNLRFPRFAERIAGIFDGVAE